MFGIHPKEEVVAGSRWSRYDDWIFLCFSLVQQVLFETGESRFCVVECRTSTNAICNLDFRNLTRLDDCATDSAPDGYRVDRLAVHVYPLILPKFDAILKEHRRPSTIQWSLLFREKELDLGVEGQLR